MNFNKDAITLSKELLGRILVHEVNGVRVKGMIVETEAYIGEIDKASHAYGGRRTERVEPLYGPAGIVYVFSIYGMYHCFNIISGEKEKAEGVLVRALEPVEGLNEMAQRRFKKNYDELTKTQIKNLTNGPSKLCIAMAIDKSHNFVDMKTSKNLYIEDGKKIEKEDIVEAKRVGIDYAEEAIHFPWRFYIKDNPWVSKK